MSSGQRANALELAQAWRDAGDFICAARWQALGMGIDDFSDEEINDGDSADNTDRG